MDQLLIANRNTSPIVEDRKFLVGAKSSVSVRPFPDRESVFPMQLGSTPTEGEKPDEEVVDPFVCRFVCRRTEFTDLRPNLGCGIGSRRSCPFGRRSAGLLLELRTRAVPPVFPRVLCVALREPLLQSLPGAMSATVFVRLPTTGYRSTV